MKLNLIKQIVKNYMRFFPVVLLITVLIGTFNSCKKITGTTRCHLDTPIVIGTSIVVKLSIEELSSELHLQYGFCYSTTNVTPLLSDPKLVHNSISDTTTLVDTLKLLEPGMRYYIRGFVLDGDEIIYSSNIVEATTIGLPALGNVNVVSANPGLIEFSCNVTSDGGGMITERGVCWSGMSSPTVENNNKIVCGSGTGEFSGNISGLPVATSYYMRAFATNISGTTYSEEVNFKSLGVGDYYRGGIIAYFLQPGDNGYIAGEYHGIIAAENDYNFYSWSNGVLVITEATAMELGYGNANTTLIVDVQGSGTYAAEHCFNLVQGGYDDWYLPSLSELQVLYNNRYAIGFIEQAIYWSSSEHDLVEAYVIHFGNGARVKQHKHYQYRSRAIRSF
ncbi:MAG: DUF1566 domain-containing protein [Bacteroidales bacterium]|nr:DUF1566 domain-containing protein [Bacteroidales bacterium]